MATLTYQKAPLVNKGDRTLSMEENKRRSSKITSTQYNKLAQAFNDRINGGAGDVAWRIWWYAHSLVRNIRMPADENVFPQTDEWWKLFGLVNPPNLAWPRDGQAGNPEGANLANPYAMFVFGSHRSVKSESARMAINGMTIKATCLYGGNSQVDLLKVWNKAKDQRGIVDYDGYHEISSNAVYSMIRQLGELEYDQLAPFLKSYCSYRPTPLMTGQCYANPYAPVYNLRFEPLIDNLPSLEFPACPNESGNVQYIHRGMSAYTLFIQDSEPVVLPYNEYLETGTQGGGTFYKVRGEQFDQMLNNLVGDARGTEAKVKTNQYDITKTGFNFEQFFKCQFRLFPAIGSTGTSIATGKLVVGEDERSYPVFRLEADIIDQTHGGPAPFYHSIRAEDGDNTEYFKVGDLLYRYDFKGIRSENTSSLLKDQDLPGYYKVSTETLTKLNDYVDFEKLGCLGGYLISHRGLKSSVTIDVLEFTFNDTGDAGNTGVSVLQGGEEITLEIGYRDTDIDKDSDKPFNTLVYFDSPVKPDRLKVKITGGGDKDGFVEFTKVDGYIHVELLQQGYYMPDILDAYGVIRLSTTNGQADAFDNMLNFDVTEYAKYFESYYKYGVIENAVNKIGDSNQYISTNSVYESTRKFLIDNLRLLDRKNLTGYKVNDAGDSVLYFRRTLPDIAGSQDPSFNADLTLVSGNKVGQLYNIESTSTLVAGGKYITTLKGKMLWRPGTYTPTGLPINVIGVSPIDSANDYAIYANARYATFETITGQAASDYTFLSSPNTQIPAFPIAPDNPNDSWKDEPVGAITSAKGVTTLRWTSWGTSKDFSPISVWPSAGAMVNGTGINNGFTYEIYRDGTLIASSTSSKTYSIISYTDTTTGDIHSGFYFEDAFTGATKYTVVQTPVLYLNSSNVVVLPKYQLYPAAFTFSYPNNYFYRVSRIETKNDKVISTTILVSDYTSSRFYDTYSFDLATKAGVTFSHKVERKEGIDGTYTLLASYPYTNYEAAVWYDTPSRPYVSEFVPYNAYVYDGINDPVTSVAITYKVDGAEGESISYAEIDLTANPPAFVQKTVIIPAINLSKPSFTWGATSVGSSYWTEARVNKNFSKSAQTVQVYIDSVTIGGTDWLVRKITTNNVATSLEASITVTTAMQAGTIPAVNEWDNSIYIYQLNSGKERLALKYGTGIESGKTYLVKAGNSGAFATYNSVNYTDGTSFTGATGYPDFTVSDVSVAVYLVTPLGSSLDFDLFDGIRGKVVTPLADVDSSKLLTVGVTYKVFSTDGETASIKYIDAGNHEVTVSKGNTFTWAYGYSSYLINAGSPYVVQEEGIVTSAPENSVANQWSMFTSFAHYSPSDSSIWKPDAYSDQLPVLHNRCHVNSFRLGSNLYSKDFGHLQKHFAYGQKPVMISEASPGYTYLEGLIGNDAGRDFYKSCQIYTPPYQIKSVQLLKAQDTSDPWYLDVDQVMVTITGRLQHGPIAAASAKIHVKDTWNTIKSGLITALANDTYRTDENGVVEYLMWFLSGGYSHSEWKNATNCRKGITGDQAPDGDVYHWSDDPQGCCFPRFYLIRNVRKVYEDANDEVDFHSYPDGPIDSPMIAYDFRVMEFYLRAMCGGFLNLAASRTSANCDDSYEDSPFADYTFEDLCYQAMTPLLDQIMCGTADTDTCHLLKDQPSINKFAPVTTEIIYSFNIQKTTGYTPIALEQNMAAFQEIGDILSASWLGWQTVPGNSFGNVKTDSKNIEYYVFTASNAFEGDTLMEVKFRIHYEDSKGNSVYRIITPTDTPAELSPSKVTAYTHILYFPFLAENPNLDASQQHTYQFRYRKWYTNNTGVGSGAWEYTPVQSGSPPTYKKDFSCVPGCTEYNETCLQLPDECDPYKTNWAVQNRDCEYCRLTINSPSAAFGVTSGTWYFAIQYQIVDNNSTLTTTTAENYVLDWPASNSMEYDVYVKYNYKSSTNVAGFSDWELFARNVRSPYTILKSQLNLDPVKDVTDFVEVGDSEPVDTNIITGGVAVFTAPNRGVSGVQDFKRTLLTPTLEQIVGSSNYCISSISISPTGTGCYGSILPIPTPPDIGGYKQCTVRVVSSSLVLDPTFVLTFDPSTSSANCGDLTAIATDTYLKGEFSSQDCQLYLVHTNSISVLFTGAPLKTGDVYIVCRTDKFMDDSTETIELGEWTVPKPIIYSSLSSVEYFEYIDTFSCPLLAKEMHWFLKKRTTMLIHWHPMATYSDSTVEYKPTYNAYVRDTSKAENITSGSENPKKLNTAVLSYPKNNPYSVDLTVSGIPDIAYNNRKFFVQAEWDSADTDPVSFKIQPRSNRRNRWFSPMPMTIRPDIPKGFGMVPYTCAYAEMFDHYSNCINLLTKCRVDIPVTLQYRKTTTYTFNKNWQHLIDPPGTPETAQHILPQGPFPLDQTLKYPHIQRLIEQKGFQLIEQLDWADLTQHKFGFDLVATNFLGGKVGDIFIAEGVTYDLATMPYSAFLHCTSRQKLDLRILPSEALYAVPAIIRPLVNLQKTLMLVQQSDQTVTQHIFESDQDRPNVITGTTAQTESASQNQTKIVQSSPLCVSVPIIGCDIKTIVGYAGNPSHSAAYSITTTTYPSSCNTVLAQSYTPLPIPSGEAIAMTIEYNENPVQRKVIGNTAGLSSKDVTIYSWLPYIDVPLRT